MKSFSLFIKRSKFFFKKVKRSYKRLISLFKKNTDVIKYAIVILVFILCIFTVTITFLEINMRYQGISDIKNNYYDINMMNATIDFDTKSKIKLNNVDDTISISIPDMEIYGKGNSFNVELYNIGSIDAEINQILITNIDTNINHDFIDIELSLKNGDVILGSERKILNILVKNNKELLENTDYINFDVRITYKEVSK